MRVPYLSEDLEIIYQPTHFVPIFTAEWEKNEKNVNIDTKWMKIDIFYFNEGLGANW